jgi:hypothetical protein
MAADEDRLSVAWVDSSETLTEEGDVTHGRDGKVFTHRGQGDWIGQSDLVRAKAVAAGRHRGYFGATWRQNSWKGGQRFGAPFPYLTAPKE